MLFCEGKCLLLHRRVEDEPLVEKYRRYVDDLMAAVGRLEREASKVDRTYHRSLSRYETHMY
jgi:hypothetical protein